jgi:hypothetical protein
MPKDCWIMVGGPLSAFAEPFRQHLIEVGHPPKSLRHYLLLMAQLDKWMRQQPIALEDLGASVACRFLEARGASGQMRVPTVASLALNWLRSQNLMPSEPPGPATPIDLSLADGA